MLACAPGSSAQASSTCPLPRGLRGVVGAEWTRPGELLMNRRLVLCASALAAAAIAFAYLPGSQDGEAAQSAALASSGPATPVDPLLPIRAVLEEGRQKAHPPRADVAQAAVQTEATTPDAAPPMLPRLGSLESAVQDVHRANPQLGTFYSLRTKAIRTSREQRHFRELLADPAMLAAAREDLLSAQRGGQEPMSQRSELERVLHIRYMASAANLEGNPNRQDAMAAMADVVMAELPSGLERDARGSLLGDKMELYQYLLLNDRARADDLMMRAKGSQLEPVLRSAMALIEPIDSATLPKK